MGETEKKEEIAQVDPRAEAKALAEAVFSKPEGVKFAAYMAEILCGYTALSSIRMNNLQNVDTEASFYTEGRRSVYLALKSLLSADTICKIERELLEKAGK